MALKASYSSSGTSIHSTIPTFLPSGTNHCLMASAGSTRDASLTSAPAPKQRRCCCWNSLRGPATPRSSASGRRRRNPEFPCTLGEH